jgi:hypothetical protein
MKRWLAELEIVAPEPFRLLKAEIGLRLVADKLARVEHRSSKLF